MKAALSKVRVQRPCILLQDAAPPPIGRGVLPSGRIPVVFLLGSSERREGSTVDHDCRNGRQDA